MCENNFEDYSECEYMGQTKRKFKHWLAEHRDYSKLDVVTEESGGQFQRHLIHSDIKTLAIQNI